MRDPWVDPARANQQHDVENHGDRQEAVESDGGRTQRRRPFGARDVEQRGERHAAGRRSGPEEEIHEEGRPGCNHCRYAPNVRTKRTICQRSDGSSSWAERGMCSVPFVITA